ncbi:hypothetical protein D2917_25465 [Cupriavidus oxalaticus]|uniref:Uncharacterized protein n=1 Tax=Cupriavidus oxalaticus TaxID=96344 RepID=A0A5P3VNC9_9BURK|nr:hypothetical protein D2917_25465 [Cupriavidus oxalaticus]
MKAFPQNLILEFDLPSFFHLPVLAASRHIWRIYHVKERLWLPLLLLLLLENVLQYHRTLDVLRRNVLGVRDWAYANYHRKK